MNWKTKAAIQRLVASLPRAERLNYLAQRHFSVGRELPESFVRSRVELGARHWHALKEQGGGLGAGTVLEIGTGWYPIVPAVLFLKGAEEVLTSDVRRHLNTASIQQAVRALSSLLEGDSPADLVCVDHHRVERLRRAADARSADEMLASFGTRGIVSRSDGFDLARQSIAGVVSNNTFQFVPAAHLETLVAELRRVVVPGGILSIAVDLGDEFALTDPTIGRLNFLRFSERQWRAVTSKLHAPNRLRFSDYRAAFEPHFQVIEARREVRLDPTQLELQPLHPSFAHYSQEDLLTEHGYFVLRRAEP